MSNSRIGLSVAVVLAATGCAGNTGAGSAMPRQLDPGATYHLRVYNQTPCPLTVVQGPASRGGRLLLQGATADRIADIAPYENHDFDAVPEPGDQIYLSLPAGYDAVGSPCDP